MRRRAFSVYALFLFASFASPDSFAHTAPLEAGPASQAEVAQQPAVPASPQITSTGGDTVQGIEAKCNFTMTETEAKKIRKANACMANAIRIRQERLSVERRLEATHQKESLLVANPVHQRAQMVIQSGAKTTEGAGGESSKTSNAGTTPEQSFFGGSLSGTPSTCVAGNGISNSALIRVHREILTAKTTADDFGYRLGHRFIVYQVTIENGSKDYQFMLQDVTVDFSQQLGAPRGTYTYSASGQDLTLLRGVPEKGEDLDPRNQILHVLQGIGSVAGAVSGLTSFADVMGPAVAVFNGSFLQGYSTIAPDHTSTQLNRLSDSAFTANTVIDKQRAKSIAIFVPADEVLSTSDQKLFRNDPFEFLGIGGPDERLNQADICVDGTFIQAVTLAAPSLSSIAFGSGSSTAAGADAVIDLTGTNLVGGDTLLVVSGTVPASAPVVASSDGKSGTAQVHLPADFDPSTTTFTLQSKSNPSLNSGTGVKLQAAKPAAVAAPSLTSAVLEKTPAPAQGGSATLDLTGTNLVNGDTIVVLSGATPTTAPVTVRAGGTVGKATVTLPSDYVLSTTTATLQSKSTPAMKSA